MTRLSQRAPLHLALLLSGFAALVYETSWTRMLHRVFGVGDLAVATVLAAFFIGLGAGSWVASRRSAHLKRPARVYALLEVAVAVYAFASPFVVPLAGQAYTAVGADAGIGALAAWRLTLSLVLLVPPTLLMGATLPVVARIVAARSGWASGVTSIYASNTLGAMLGVGVAGFVLIPQLGNRVSTWIAAFASLLAAVIVFQSYRRVDEELAAEADRPPTDDEEEEDEEGADDDEEADEEEAGDDEEEAADDEEEAADEPDAPAEPSIWLPAFLAAGTGLSALAGEVLWTRILRTVLHATTQAFSGMLLCYLFGIAVGAYLARRLAKGKGGPALALGIAQVVMALLIVLAMLALPQVIRVIPMLRGEMTFVPHRPLTIIAVSAALLLPLAVVSGTGLPLVWALAERGEDNAVRGAGRLLAANTIGGGLGSVVAGFVMVPAMGVEASLMVVMFVHLVLAGLALRKATANVSPVLRALSLTTPLAIGVGVLLAQPTVHMHYLLRARRDPMQAILHGPDANWAEPVIFFEEGRASTVMIERAPTNLTLSNDGRPESGIGPNPPGFGPELAVLGSLPVLFAQNTDRALVIGLGAGHTTSVLLGGEFGRVDVVELEEAIVVAAQRLHSARGLPFPLDDDRANLVVDDARNRLALAEPGTYDAIVSQPSHPWLAGSSALYTREFFEETREALSDGGVLALWINLFRIQPRQIRAVVGTLREVFPYVQGFVVEESSLVLSATSHEPRWDAGLEQRIARVGEAYLEPFQIGNPAALARALEIDPDAARIAGEGAPRIVDDRPLLEFELAATPMTVQLDVNDLDGVLADVPWLSQETVAWMPDAADVMVRRVNHVLSRPRAIRRVEASLPEAGLSPADEGYVVGAIAQARGDVRGALAAWDASTRPEAAGLADLLRAQEGMPRAAIARAEARETAPDRATALLIAGLEIGEVEWMRRALDVIERSAEPPPAALRTYVEAESRAPCSAWQAQPRVTEELARTNGVVAFRAQRCAFAAGQDEAARRLGTFAVRGRRAAAETAWSIGETCRVGGNGGCALLMLRRALREYPSHSRAAAALARIHVAGGRRAEATAVLRRTAEATQGIAASQARLAQVAEELDLELGVELPRSDESPSSTAPGL